MFDQNWGSPQVVAGFSSSHEVILDDIAVCERLLFTIEGQHHPKAFHFSFFVCTIDIELKQTGFCHSRLMH